MNDYIPLSALGDLPSPHDAQPTRRDPWFVWAIAASPLPPFAALLVVGTSSQLLSILIMVVVVLATTAGCVHLAHRDRAAITQLGENRPVSPNLAVLPPLYLLTRAARRALSPHRGNPVAPLLLNLALGFIVAYYLLLFLAGIAGTVNLELNALATLGE